MSNAKEYYDKHSGEYAKKWEAMDKEFSQSNYFRQKIMEAVLSMADLRKEDKVVEIGCGSGLVLREALKKVRPVFGTDISAGMLQRVRDSVLSGEKTMILNDFSGISRQSGEADAYLMINDLLNLNLPADYFDKILSVEVLRYVDDPDKAFANIAAIMKKSSLFVFTVTNFWSAGLFPLKYSARKLLGLVNSEKELLQYFATKKTVCQKLKKAGLVVKKFERLGLLFANPLTKRLIKGELAAKKFEKRDRLLAKIPIIKNFFDTFVVAAQKF